MLAPMGTGLRQRNLAWFSFSCEGDWLHADRHLPATPFPVCPAYYCCGLLWVYRFNVGEYPVFVFFVLMTLLLCGYRVDARFGCGFRSSGRAAAEIARCLLTRMLFCRGGGRRCVFEVGGQILDRYYSRRFAGEPCQKLSIVAEGGVWSSLYIYITTCSALALATLLS